MAGGVGADFLLSRRVVGEWEMQHDGMTTQTHQNS